MMRNLKGALILSSKRMLGLSRTDDICVRYFWGRYNPSSPFLYLRLGAFPIQTPHSCDMFNSQPYPNPEFHRYDRTDSKNSNHNPRFPNIQKRPSSFGFPSYYHWTFIISRAAFLRIIGMRFLIQFFTASVFSFVNFSIPDS